MGKKNLHEAFQEAAERQRATLERESEVHADPEPAPALPAPALPAPALPEPRGRASHGASALDRPYVRGRADAFRQPIVLAAMVVAFALGTLFGSRSEPAVSAEPGSEILSGAAPATAEPLSDDLEVPLLSAEGADAPDILTQVARALADPNNRYTIQVATYGRTERGLGWAKDLVSWMEQNELPVAPPQEVGDHYVVLVGVGRTQVELEELLMFVQQMPTAAQTSGTFVDAFIINIDKLIGR